MKLDLVQILAHIVNIVILYFFLRWLLYKPISKFIKEREQRYSQREEDMKAREDEASTLKQKYEKLMEETRLSTEGIISQSRANANKRAEEIIEEARAQARNMLDHARTDIAEERKTAQAAMAEEVADLAVTISSRILEREVGVEDNKHIVEKFLTRERIG